MRADDPALTVRLPDGERGPDDTEPLRVVLGRAPDGRRGAPVPRARRATSATVLDELGAEASLQLLVEGGATVAHAFHAAGLVDRYVALPRARRSSAATTPAACSPGPAPPTIDDVWRGRIVSRRADLGDDLRIDLDPTEEAD